MKKNYYILIIIISIGLVYACSKEESTESVGPETPASTNPTSTSNNDTIIPFTVSNCCDTNFNYTGQFDTSIIFIPNFVTPNGDGYNDIFAIESSVILNPTQASQFLLEVFDSLNTKIYSGQPNTPSSKYLIFSFPSNLLVGNLNMIDYKGKFNAKITSQNGAVEFNLCMISVGTDCNNSTCGDTCSVCSCFGIDNWDPSLTY